MKTFKWYHKKRLQKLADFLKQLKKGNFYFGDFVTETNKNHSCGTVCCAIGWMPKVDSRNWRWKKWRTSSMSIHPYLKKNIGLLGIFDDAADYFGISRCEANSLFSPDSQEDLNWDSEEYNFHFSNLDNYATPKQVAKLIEKFIKYKTKQQQYGNL